jgi:hypothetical protein
LPAGRASNISVSFEVTACGLTSIPSTLPGTAIAKAPCASRVGPWTD